MAKRSKKAERLQTNAPVALGELIHACVRGAIETAVHEELATALGVGRYEHADGPAVAMDMLEPYMQSTRAHVPAAEVNIVFDKFRLGPGDPKWLDAAASAGAITPTPPPEARFAKKGPGQEPSSHITGRP